jgi:hypothetical protein
MWIAWKDLEKNFSEQKWINWGTNSSDIKWEDRHHTIKLILYYIVKYFQ